MQVQVTQLTTNSTQISQILTFIETNYSYYRKQAAEEEATKYAVQCTE